MTSPVCAGFEHRDWQLHTANKESLRKLWPHSGGHKVSQHFPVLTNSAFTVNENVLHSNNTAFHAGDLRDTDNLTSAVAHTIDLNHDVECRRDLPTDCIFGD